KTRPEVPEPPARPSGCGPKAWNSPVNGGSGDLAQRALLDPLLVLPLKDALDEDAGRMDRVRVQFAGRHQFLDLGHRDAPAGGDDRIEVPRRLAEDQIALMVALPRLDDGQVGDEAAFENVILPVEPLDFLALGDLRADA